MRFGRQRKESIVSYARAIRQPQLPQLLPLLDEGSDCKVSKVYAALKINLENFVAVVGERENGAICNLRAAVELELVIVSDCGA